MNGRKPNILSVPHRPSMLLFDACHMGVVLRALALVELPLVVWTLFAASGLEVGLSLFAELTAAVMPPTLLWLLLACTLKRWLDGQTASVQWGFAILCGWLCALLGLALHRLLLPTAAPLKPNIWLAASVMGVGLAVLLTSMFVMRQRAHQPAATVARLAELQSRIRPHFLFNTLNSAIALVREDPTLAERMLEDLSDLFRHALKDAASISSLDKEIEIARQYLRIEGIRFGQRLRVTWTVDEAALQASVPPLLLQPLVENAIKHGIEPSAEGGEIHILVRRKQERVLVRVSNTVASARALGEASTRAGNGIALRNVRARLRLMHDVNADFRCAVRAGRYEVAMGLPAQPLLGRDALQSPHSAGKV